MTRLEMMGTHCLTYVYDGSTPLVCLWRQFDGYPAEHGMELVEILQSIKSVDDMAQVAKQIVASFKASVTEAHHEPFYIVPCDTEEFYDQDYEYHVYSDRVIVKNYNGHIMIDIDWDGFKEFCLSNEE